MNWHAMEARKMAKEAVQSMSDKRELSDMTTRREETIDTVCERLALGKTLSQVCRSADMPDRRTVQRWAAKDAGLAQRLLTARRLGAWAMFDESTDRLKNATSQNIQVEREFALHVRWTLSKLVPDVFSERRDASLNLADNKITISWMAPEDAEMETAAITAKPGVSR